MRESEQLASGSLNGRFRGGSPGRTVKKSVITGAVLGPNWLRTESDCPLIVSKTVCMFITVAPDASPGDYYHDVRAEGKAFGITVEDTVYTNVLTTVIPEFSMIAIPAAAIFILLFFIRRRRA